MIVYSVIIPTFNASRTLIPLLESLADLGEDTEVLVVDDGSTDGTAERVAKFPTVRYVAMEQNGGPAAARNRGAALAQGTWLVFTDADTLFLPGTFQAIREALSTFGGDGLVGTYAGTPANRGWMPRYKALWEYHAIDRRIPVDEQGLAPYFTWAPRPGVVRRDAFETVGGFDEAFQGADLEDLDLGYRLIAAGFRIYYCERVQIKHHYPESLRAELAPFARRCVLWMRMRRRWPKLDAAGEGSPSVALAHLAGFLATLTLPLSIFLPKFGFVPLGFLLVHWGMNHQFLRAARRQDGAAFALACAGLTWLHSTVLGFAAAWGLVTAPRPGK